MLDDFGLNETISLYCEELSLLSGIACSLESSYTESELTPEMRVDLFRICQELLTNVIRHANANKAKVIIKSIKEQIVLSVIDDGKGFDQDTTVMGKGLIHIKSRVTSFNGQLIINSRAGAGTNISVIAPRH
jgi:signal transduction histidine kinase